MPAVVGLKKVPPKTTGASTQDVQPTKRKAESVLPKVPVKTKPRPPDNPRTKAISKLKTRTYKIWECLDDAGVMTDVDDLAGLREVLKRWKIARDDDVGMEIAHAMKMERREGRLDEQFRRMARDQENAQMLLEEATQRYEEVAQIKILYADMARWKEESKNNYDDMKAKYHEAKKYHDLWRKDYHDLKAEVLELRPLKYKAARQKKGPVVCLVLLYLWLSSVAQKPKGYFNCE